MPVSLPSLETIILTPNHFGNPLGPCRRYVLILHCPIILLGVHDKITISLKCLLLLPYDDVSLGADDELLSI